MQTMVDGLIMSQDSFKDQKGTILEFGVFVGNSTSVIAEIISKHLPKLNYIGFDSWRGLPEETDGVWIPDRHKKGEFSSTKDVVLTKLKNLNLENDNRFRFVDGFFEDSLTKEVQDSISDLVFVNIDVDIHSSTVLVLEFIRPLLRPGVVLYFDDWKDPQDKYDGKWGEHLAWEQFIEKYPEIKHETILINRFGQRCIKIL